ncbi:hypothetical protein PINS_up021299 [Pythium insidiosum]|nr:hypothetical protein PINS_up021299 [Pythium insidiosum]
MSTSILDVPPPIWHSILAFAAPEYRYESVPEKMSLPLLLLRSLIASSPAWIPLLQPLVHAFHTAALDFAVTTTGVDEIHALQRLVQQRHGSLRCLSLCLEPSAMLCDVEAPINPAWHAVFAACPRLERLEISGISARSPVFQSVLDAAAANCRVLQALALCENVEDVERETRRRHIVVPIHRALHVWRSARTLRQLRLPSSMLAIDDDYGDDLLRHIVQCAPNVEFLDAWRSSYSEYSRIECSERLWCTSAVWSAFTQTCSSLRELNWVMFPISNARLATFGNSHKPLLESLTFAGVERPSLTIDGSDDDSLTDYDTEGLKSALRACPNLKSLRVVFDMGMSSLVSVPRQRHWGDAFLQAVARSCSRLRELSIVELNGGVNNIPIPLETITDDGVMSLAVLPELISVELKASRCTPRGVFELLVTAPTSGPPRMIKLDVGCLFVEGFVEDESDDPEVITFYDFVSGLLHRLHQADVGAEFSTRRFEFLLVNKSRRDPDTAEWRAGLETLRQKLSTRVRISLREEDGRLDQLKIHSEMS